MTYQEGDGNHLAVHNQLTADVGDLASSMGVEVVLPDTAVVGSTGHVDDHNLIKDALDKIANEGSAGASWAQVINAPDAVTSSYYDDKGGQWQFWEWNAPGTFDVEISGGLLWVLCVGGGSNGYSSSGNLNQGQPGLVNEGLWEFGPGTHTVTVGDVGAQSPSVLSGWSGIGSRVGGFTTQGGVSFGWEGGGRGGITGDTRPGFISTITGDPLEYAPAAGEPQRPGQGKHENTAASPGCVIIATRIDVPTLPPAPPRLEVAPVVAAPVSISGPAVQEWLVRDKQGNRKVVYFLPGNTGTARSLGLTEDGAEALAARRDVLDAIATTEVPEDFTGDPVTLLPKKLRGELTGFVEVRATPQPEAVYSVTLGAGVLPGVMVAAGGHGGGVNGTTAKYSGGGGAGGVLGQGAHSPVILPVQGTATYTVAVGSTTPHAKLTNHQLAAQATTLAVQGQTPFASAFGGGYGTNVQAIGADSVATGTGSGASGGGAGSWSDSSRDGPYAVGGAGLVGQGNQGAAGTDSVPGGGGGYGSRPTGGNGGAGFDLATALNLDPNDGITGQFLSLVSVDGFIAGGGAAYNGTATAGGGAYAGGNGKDYAGGGGGGHPKQNGYGGVGGAGAVYLITDPT